MIRLLSPLPYTVDQWPGLTAPAGAVVSLDSATEAGLIASGMAVSSAGPVTWTPPVTPRPSKGNANVQTITPAELAAPTAAMLADTSTIFVCNGVRYLTNADGTALVAIGLVSSLSGGGHGIMLPNGSVAGLSRVLKNTSTQYQLTGGSVGVKTTLLQVNIPDGALLNYNGSLTVQVVFGYSQNTNSKSFGVDIGATAGGASSVYSRTRSGASQGADTQEIRLARHPTVSTQLINTFGGNTAQVQWGSPGIATASIIATLGVDPAATGLSLYFWARLDTSASDQVTLGHTYVRLEYGE